MGFGMQSGGSRRAAEAIQVARVRSATLRISSFVVRYVALSRRKHMVSLHEGSTHFH